MSIEQADSIQYDHILVRYGELTTKGKNKNEFIKKLVVNVKRTLKKYPTLTYERTHDRLYIMLHDEPADEVQKDLACIFGIHSFSLAIKVNSDLEEIIEAAYLLMKNKSGTFKVEARRSNKRFPYISDEINRAVASKILVNLDQLKVDVKQPDTRLKIEVHESDTYMMCDVIYGAGGYPVGVGGKALVMLSGGIDSPIASYLMMKRGVVIECVHYASPPYTSEAAQDKVMTLAKKLTKFQGRVRVHVVPFTKLQMAIYQHADESYAITLMRRMMYRIAEQMLSKTKCKAIVNGESLGQVASQTLESMETINQVTNVPILRPLITYDKLEIINIAKKIDTYETSILPFEDCCTIFTPKRPVIKPKVEKAIAYEALFDYQTFIDEIIAETKIIDIDYIEKAEHEDFF